MVAVVNQTSYTENKRELERALFLCWLWLKVLHGALNMSIFCCIISVALRDGGSDGSCDHIYSAWTGVSQPV